MIELMNLTLPLTADDAFLRSLAAKKLKTGIDAIVSVRYLKKSVDARKKSNVVWAASLGVTVKGDEGRLLKKAGNPQARLYAEPISCFPARQNDYAGPRPVVVGAGPAGLFAALTLAKAGLKPLLIERGADADTRAKTIDEFISTGQLSEQTNVQFGEGGAGTFSDGKLTTNIHDPRCSTVLRTFYECGAPEEILYLGKPHLGTDNLLTIVKNLREAIIREGGEVRFLTRLTDIFETNGHLSGCEIESEGVKEILPCEKLVIASGHSARDVFEMLKAHSVSMEQKPFSIGVRIEHKQEAINRAQYGDAASLLPAADYKFACHLPSGRSVYTFCMCPGGVVMAAASEQEHLVVNGMSRFARDGENANAALLCSVEPADFGSDDVLAGVDFQQQYEHRAWIAGGRNFRAPAQLSGDFLAGRKSTHGGHITPSYPLGVTWGDLSDCLPGFAVDALKAAIPEFDKKLHGFADPDAVLTGVETRSSSPVRVKRDEETLEASIPGLYPCGEGAGYAGGIMSAAVDGIRVGQKIAERTAGKI